MLDSVSVFCKSYIKMSSLTTESIAELLNSRQSVGLLVEPAPTRTQLEVAIQAALTAPDHHRLQPWRFVLIEQSQRAAFGELLSKSLAEDGERDLIQLERAKQHPLRAPMILVCIMQYQPHPKVPHYEQVLSCGAAIQNILLILQDQGFASIWRTGAIAQSTHFKQMMGCNVEDEIAGLLYIGTAGKQIAPRQALAVENFLTTWQEA